MILCIPVENGHTGGQIKVKSNTRCATFDTSVKSNRKFHLIALYNGYEHEIETVASGWMVALSVNLVWGGIQWQWLIQPCLCLRC